MNRTPEQISSVLRASILVMTVLASASAGNASAQSHSSKSTKSATPASRPWAVGVSAKDQAKALAIFKSGNQHLSKLRFSDAVEAYRKALKHWEHPVIHYYLTTAFIRLSKPLEAYEAIGKALQYDSAPLNPEQYEQALNYQALLRNQVAHIEIASRQPGTSVLLDGKPYLTGPGSVRKAILPGHHQIVATRKGHEKVADRVLLLPGKSKRVQLKLFTSAELTKKSRYWPAWKPWALAGGGVALASVGGLWHWRAKVNIDEFDHDEFPKVCPGGCADHDGSLRRAHWLQGIGLGHYTVGGAALAAGLILGYINRPRKERLDRDDESVRIFVQPTLSPVGPGAAVGGSW